MREIKFRAWDGGRMLSDPKIGFSEGKYNYSINDELQSSDYIYMQYTGLKDKNGKEIYFEDYVLYKNTVYRVVWNKYKISLENISQKYISDLTEVIISDLSVLGNTYENEFNIIKQYKEI